VTIILIDSTIFMYAAGAAHPAKEPIAGVPRYLPHNVPVAPHP